MSPIHDQSYRRYRGTRQPLGRSWSVIASAGIQTMLGKKTFLGLLLVAWVPFIVFAFNIYRVEMFPQTNAFWPVNVRFFQQFIEVQGIWLFFITIFVGSGLIASDRRANALQIYLSKPLLRMEYIGGKLLILMVFLLQASLLPALLLVILQVGFSGSFDFIRANAYVVPAVTLASLVRVVVAAFAMLALSSLSKSTRYVAMLYTGVIFFTESMYGVLTLVTGSTRVAWISITRNFDIVTDLIFRQPARYDTPAIVAVLVLTGIVVVSISVLERRVRGVEVVS